MERDYYMKWRIADVILGVYLSSIFQEELSYVDMSLIDSQKESSLLTSVSEVDVRTWASLAQKR